MIQIIDKHRCCGCEACAQRCPKQCIIMTYDDEGFLYPLADESICIGCSLCEKVCPVINQKEPKKPLKVFAAINPDEDTRKKSSSGGIFSAIAEKVIAEGGVVFGAQFNDKWEVVHGYVERTEELNRLRGAKYVQSRVGSSYQQVESFLKSGRKVLFSGTSCQVAGLNKYLRKEYDNLLMVDVVCHGVPSPKLWHDYISSLADISPVKTVNMKDKADGWIGYKITIEGEKAKKTEKATVNKYMLAFSRNLSLRPACYQCPAKEGKSCSDITLADYWGVEKLIPKMYDNKGTSFVCVNSAKGETVLEALPIKIVAADYDASVPYNACIAKSTPEPVQRLAFWLDYKENGIVAIDALRPNKPNIIKRALRWIERMIK